MTSVRPEKDQLEYEKLLEEEELILSATELIYQLMAKQGVSKADLARAVGRTRGYITQILDGSRNMTLRTLADVALALGHRVEIEAKPRSIGAHSPRPVSSAVVHDFGQYLRARQLNRPVGYDFAPNEIPGDKKKATVGA